MTKRRVGIDMTEHDHEMMVDGMLSMRDTIPIEFEPPPDGEKGWAYLAVLLLNVKQRMTPAAMAVLGTLIDHANPKTGQCNPSVTRISVGAGVSRRTAFRSLAELQEFGLVANLAKNHNGARRRRGNAYQINWAELLEALALYEDALNKAKRFRENSTNARRTLAPQTMGDTKLTPTSDSKLSPIMVTPAVTLNLKAEPITEPNTPKVARADARASCESHKSSDSEVLKRYLSRASREWP
jgi:hypothetical protein